jgi:hypothetical protein
MFSDISNRDKSNKDKPRFRNLKIKNRNKLRFSKVSNTDKSNKDNPWFKNRNSNINHRLSNLRDRSNPNNSILDPRTSNTRRNHNTSSLKENLKEGMQDMESRRTRS